MCQTCMHYLEFWGHAVSLAVFVLNVVRMMETEGKAVCYIFYKANLSSFCQPFYQLSLFLLVFNRVLSLTSAVVLKFGSLIIVTQLSLYKLTWLSQREIRHFHWFTLCCDLRCQREVSVNVTSNTVMWKGLKNHDYLHESVSRCPLPAFLTDYGVLAYGIRGRGVCVCGWGGWPDCREGSLSQGAGWAV